MPTLVPNTPDLPHYLHLFITNTPFGKFEYIDAHAELDVDPYKRGA